jgi:probable rRNA maturation factor
VAIRWRGRAVSARFVRGVVRAALAAEGKALRLSVALVGDREIRALNRRFLGHDHATDVLAFPLGGDPGPETSPSWAGVDGEVVVGLERAVKVARRMGHPWRAELALYLVHGTLHLCGHDDHDPARGRLMLRREREILASLGYHVPQREVPR